jgi:predicted TIM-barrel fold metal-dependent hydrolase
VNNKTGLVVDLCITIASLPILELWLQAAPNVSFVLDHCGMHYHLVGQPNYQQLLQQWKFGISKIAQYPNLNCKVSGLRPGSKATDDNWCLDSNPQRATFEYVLDSFDVNKLIYCSDWPVSALAFQKHEKHTFIHQYVNQLYQLIQRKYATSTTGDQNHATSVARKIFVNNALRVYNINV